MSLRRRSLGAYAPPADGVPQTRLSRSPDRRTGGSKPASTSSPRTQNCRWVPHFVRNQLREGRSGPLRVPNQPSRSCRQFFSFYGVSEEATSRLLVPWSGAGFDLRQQI